VAPVVEVAEGCLDFPVLCFSLIGLLDPLILSMLIKEKKSQTNNHQQKIFGFNLNKSISPQPGLKLPPPPLNNVVQWVNCFWMGKSPLHRQILFLKMNLENSPSLR